MKNSNSAILLLGIIFCRFNAGAITPNRAARGEAGKQISRLYLQKDARFGE